MSRNLGLAMSEPSDAVTAARPIDNMPSANGQDPGNAGVPRHAPLMDSDLVRYVSVVLRHKWLLATAAVVGLAAGFIVSRMSHPVYVAQGTVWIEARERDGGNPGPIAPSQLLRSYGWIELLKSYTVLDSVIANERLYIRTRDPDHSRVFADFKLQPDFRPGTYRASFTSGTFAITDDEDSPIQRGKMGEILGTPVGFAWVPPESVFRQERTINFRIRHPRDVARQLSLQLEASMAEDGRFLRLQLKGLQPRQLAATLNAVMTRYVEVAAQLKRAKLNELTRILEEQRQYAESTLRDSEMALEAFRVQTITKPSGQGSPVAPGLELTRDPVLSHFFQMKTSLDDLRRDRSTLQQIQAQIAQGSLSMDVLASVAAAQKDAALSSLLNELTEKRAELRALQKQYASEHAAVRAMESWIAGLETVAIPRAALELDTQLAAQDRDMSARIESASTELREIPPRAIEEARLQRRVEIAATLHGVLRQRYEEARLAAVSTIADVRILDRATVPFAPVKDLRKLIVAGSVVSMIGLALLGIFVAHKVDGRVRYPEQVTAGMGLPILTAIPHLKELREARVLNGSVQLTEAFRELRFNVIHAHGTAGPLVLSLSSPESGDGKSVVAANLAMMFAAHGERVLLIDADVRRGSLHRYFRARRAPGLTDYLISGRPLQEVTQSVAGLTFLASGIRTARGPELLGAPRMAGLIREFRAEYGVIIIDTPPLSAGVDAFALAALAGNLVLVLRTGSTDAQLAEAKLDLVDRLPVRVLGAVLNDVPPSRAYRYYSYLPGYQAEDEPGTQLTLAGRIDRADQSAG